MPVLPRAFLPSVLRAGVHGSSRIPIVLVDAASLEAVIGAHLAKISGVQPKFTADASSDGSRLVPSELPEGGRFIVKPQWRRKHLPENEHLAMCLARLVGIEVAACALLQQTDGATTYVTRRFDRDDSDPPRSLSQLDFCQLLNLPQDAKYDRPATLCAEVIERYSVDARGDLARLFRLLVFCYWIGNGDLHLKNLSLVDRGGYRLSPAYDLACSYVFGDEKLALPVRNRQKDVPRREWLAFAASCRLGEDEAASIIDSMLDQFDDCRAMIRRSPLHPDYQSAYLRCLTKRRRALQDRRAPR